ncbi:MAG: hypothetical protein J3Q66DRAFT_330503 [Benniella sp.]|nr:MAG: hypothetical protein J3Q66DRAFT_330503 [Benniella sp.]
MLIWMRLLLLLLALFMLLLLLLLMLLQCFLLILHSLLLLKLLLLPVEGRIRTVHGQPNDLIHPPHHPSPLHRVRELICRQILLHTRKDIVDLVIDSIRGRKRVAYPDEFFKFGSYEVEKSKVKSYHGIFVSISFRVLWGCFRKGLFRRLLICLIESAH